MILQGVDDCDHASKAVFADVVLRICTTRLKTARASCEGFRKQLFVRTARSREIRGPCRL